MAFAATHPKIKTAEAARRAAVAVKQEPIVMGEIAVPMGTPFDDTADFR
jgi:hypothetical protein